MSKVLLLVLGFSVFAKAQVPFLGRCPNLSAKQSFEPSRYLGKWYEAEKYFAIFEFGGKCITANYTALSSGAIGVFNKQINIVTNGESTIQGTATLSGAPNEGKLSVVFPSVPFARAAPYWILDTDYDNYSIVHSCSEFLFINTRILWILTRARNPSASLMNQIYDSIDKIGLNRAFLIKTDQRNCPTYY